MIMNLPIILNDPGTKQPSISLTMAVVAFTITTLNYLLGMFAGTTIDVLGTKIVIAAFDSTACAAFLIPILSLYFARKATQAKSETAKLNNE